MDVITQEDLREYQKIKQRIRVLEEEINAVYLASPKPKEAMAGRASVRTPSDPTQLKAFRVIDLREKLEEQLEDLRAQEYRIIQFTLNIPDAEIGSMIRLHYVRGYTWEETTRLLYGYPDRSYCYVRIKRYFERTRQNDNEETDAGAGTEGVHREQTDLQPDSGGSDDNR